MALDCNGFACIIMEISIMESIVLQVFAYFITAIIAIFSFWRINKRKNLLSFEYTHEVIIWAFLVGLDLVLFFILALSIMFPVDINKKSSKNK